MKKNKRYLIACSGGPDSMALLDMYYKKGFYIEVGHVNYHKRQTADRDEKIVKDYCKKHDIVCHVLNVLPEHVKGNFQAFARKIRYSWFYDICVLDELDEVLVAHQEDDLLETYLMQKSKKLGVSEYGLAEYNEIYGAKVYRPLLDKTKKQLLNYCIRNNIEYGIDESNLSDDYTRNKVRHSKVEKMSKDEREALRIEILKKNIEIKQKENATLRFLYEHLNKHIEIKEFNEFEYPNLLIRNIFEISMSDKYVDEVVRQIKTCDSYKLIRNNICLVKEYGYIEYFKMPQSYSFKVKKDELFYTDYFKIQRSGKDSFSCAKVKDDDYPLTIRNYKEGDFIKMTYGTKKVNRFFIDNKIPYKDRLIWPIVLNKKGTAILVPGIGCDIDHYDKKANLYVLKLDYYGGRYD